MKHFPQQSTVDYYQASPLGALGEIVTTTPIVAAARKLKPNGTGLLSDDGSDTHIATAVIIIGLGLAGALSYQAGKAMAPSRADAKTWGWIGVPVGMFTGPLGLGLMGIISNSKKGY